MGLEHQVELADAGEVLLAAHGANDVVLGDVGLQLGVGPAVAGLGALGEVLDELVGAEAGLAGLAVHERVVEAAHVAGGYPYFPVHQDGAVQAGVVRAFLDKLLPPGLLDVVLQLHAQGAVVPGVGQAAVDLAARKNKAAVLAKSHQLIHRELRHCVFLPHVHVNTLCIIGAKPGFVKVKPMSPGKKQSGGAIAAPPLGMGNAVRLYSAAGASVGAWVA